jgi:hypothetical protein
VAAEVELANVPWYAPAAAAIVCLAIGAWAASGDRFGATTDVHGHEKKVSGGAVLAAGIGIGVGLLAVEFQSSLLLFLSMVLLIALALLHRGRPEQAIAALSSAHIAAVLGGLSIVVARWVSLGGAEAASMVPIRGLDWIVHCCGYGDFTFLPPYVVSSGVRVHLSHFLRPTLLAAPLACVFLIRTGDRRVWTRLLAAVFVTAVLYVLLTIAVAQSNLRAVLCSEKWLFATSVGSLFVVVLLWRPEEGVGRFDIRGLGVTYGAVAAAIAVLSVVSSVEGVPSGSATIAVDEGHGRWESVVGAVDTLTYGRSSSYNYVLLRQWLEQNYRVTICEQAFVDSIRGDVLLVKMPTTPYNEDEIALVERWVRRGGVLLLVGDHTNLFGSSWIANELLKPFGLRFRDDATVALHGPDYVLRERWETSNVLLRGLGDVMLQTACTIEARNLRTEPLLVCRGAVAEAAVYSNDRFFGALDVSPDDRVGPFAVATYTPYGRGSVILFCDSTVWSSFCFYSPPYKELLDGLIQLGLLRPVRIHVWIWILVAVVIACSAWLSGGPFWRWGLTAGVLFVTWSPLGLSADNALSRPIRTLGGKQLLVDTGLSRVGLSTDIRTGAAVDLSNYSAFLGALPRVGVVPEFRTIKYDQLRGDEAVLVVCSEADISQRTKASMESFVRRGGRLLLFLDCTASRPPYGGDLLAFFGAHVEQNIQPVLWSSDSGPDLPTNILGLPFALAYAGLREPGGAGRLGAELGPTLIGMEPILVDTNGRCVYARRSVGRGAVYALVQPATFSQYVMGDVWMGADLDRFKRDIYSLSYGVVTPLFAEE